MFVLALGLVNSRMRWQRMRVTTAERHYDTYNANDRNVNFGGVRSPTVEQWSKKISVGSQPRITAALHPKHLQMADELRSTHTAKPPPSAAV